MSFLAELKRRNVFRVGIAYVVGGWLLLQLTDVLSQLLDLPEVVGRVIVLLVAIGLPVALFFAWAFEMTPEGVKREKDVDRSQSITPQTGKKLNHTIIVLLVLAVAYLLYDKFAASPVSGTPTVVAEPASTAGEAPAKTPVSGKSHEEDKSIAVLPFTNRSPNADDAYFTDGVHDDLLTQLAKIDAFSVISRTSVMEYKDTAKNLRQIGEELGVANILEGAVQRSGQRVRINVQLIDAVSDEHLWAEVYDRELTTENLFDIQTEIAKSIAGALQATLTDSEIESVSDVPTENVAAYELYLQGKKFSLGETETGFDTAVELYKEALKLDPGFKLAWVGLAYAYMNNYWNYGADPADRDRAREAIDRAKAIDPDFPELYMAEGFYHYWGLLDYDTAILYLDKSIALMPSNAEAHMWKGWALRRAGRWEQALDSMQMAIRLNPRVIINLIETGQTFAYQRRFDEALEVTEKAYALEPDNFWTKSYLALLLINTSGDIGRAETLMVGGQYTDDPTNLFNFWLIKMLAGRFETALETANNWSGDWEMNVKTISLRESLIAMSLNAQGRFDEAKENARIALDRLEQIKQQGIDDFRVWTSELEAYAIIGDRQKVAELAAKIMALKPVDAVEDFNIRYRFAQSYAYAGMLNECIATLDTLLSGISAISVPWVEHDPAFNSIRNTPEFIALLEKHR
jgi:TolB-like protein/Flp pilus assembly protein TadD